MESSVSSLASIDYAEVIIAAASSEFGMLALMILTISFVACIMFRKSGEKYRLTAFVMIFVSFIIFGKTIIDQKHQQETSLALANNETPTKEPDKQIDKLAHKQPNITRKTTSAIKEALNNAEEFESLEISVDKQETNNNLGNRCCDTSGVARCTIEAYYPLGQSCMCFYQGYGYVCR
ncbi:hypothetical protein [Pleionea sp. CnH1-48]|uniref:hypothetical protein n=1 Tax=Pleionea sp. CnH1-48 TaxID=2954494 RepID=UPI0020971DA5|nr:hypothetical protein [Pleionea sp. CnH1-48]MCO7223727.1 hypothetical protein [Pleionea sp. CnH1-48]